MILTGSGQGDHPFSCRVNINNTMCVPCTVSKIEPDFFISHLCFPLNLDTSGVRNQNDGAGATRRLKKSDKTFSRFVTEHVTSATDTRTRRHTGWHARYNEDNMDVHGATLACNKSLRNKSSSTAIHNITAASIILSTQQSTVPLAAYYI